MAEASDEVWSVPTDDVTVIERDGKIRGQPPLTLREPSTAGGGY